VREEVKKMVDLVIRRDPFRSLFAWPKWGEDFDDVSFQKGLKIHETNNDIVAEAVVAGVPAEDVEVEIEDGVLTIKAETKEEENLPAQARKKGEYRSSSYKYYYTCALSGGAWDKASADVKHGVVTITVPKAKAAKPRKIKVKAA
jgi:HSP20 family protein